MLQLLIQDPNPDAGATAKTTFGGMPSAQKGELAWPTCKTCHGPMQFLGQIRTNGVLGNHLLLLFMCQNEPGMCDEWAADGGGNAVIVVPTDDLKLAQPPSGGVTLRPVRYGTTMVGVEAEDYGEALDKWRQENPGRPREVLGQLGGEPGWIQSDETPGCDICRTPMSFVAQLEEGPDHRTAMNFGGGGCAYVFQCSCSGTTAKMLWQC